MNSLLEIFLTEMFSRIVCCQTAARKCIFCNMWQSAYYTSNKWIVTVVYIYTYVLLSQNARVSCSLGYHHIVWQTAYDCSMLILVLAVSILSTMRLTFSQDHNRLRTASGRILKQCPDCHRFLFFRNQFYVASIEGKNCKNPSS